MEGRRESMVSTREEKRGRGGERREEEREEGAVGGTGPLQKKG